MNKEEKCDKQGEQFRRNDSKPNACNAEKKRQDENGGTLQQKSSQKGDGGGNGTVVERGEERRPPYVYAHHQEREGVQTEAVARHGIQFDIVSGKNFHQRCGEQFGKCGQNDAGNAQQNDTLAKQAFEFVMIGGTVVIADNRRTAEGIAEENCHKDEIDIHDDAIGGNTVFARDLHQSEIIQNADERSGKVGDHFAGTVGTSVRHDFSVIFCTRQLQ